MVRILLAEEDEALQQLYHIALQDEAYKIYSARTGTAALGIMEQMEIDLVITDTVLSEVDGYELAQWIRRFDANLPIIMTSASLDFADCNKGYMLGIDDYMIKPINPQELLLRVKALLRRAHIMSLKQLEIGHMVLDHDAFVVYVEGEEVPLTPKEFSLLYQLLSYPNKIFTRIQLMDQIWGKESESNQQTVDVHINRLRRKFQHSPDFTIMAIRGLGYKAVLKEDKTVKIV